MTEPILVADIGGTNARFALADSLKSVSAPRISVRAVETYRADAFKTVGDAIDAYLKSTSEQPKTACFAAAGPVRNNSVDFTNSPWRLDGDAIATSFAFDALTVVNDFVALAAGVSHLEADAFLLVKDGNEEPNAPTLVIGPGTGLGQAIIVPTTSGEHVVSTEGGHVLFAPRTSDEVEIVKFIAREHDRVSIERLLSGNGLVNIYNALCAMSGTQAEPLQAQDITAAAEGKSNPIAVRTVDLFCALLGRIAGDAVLATGARGSVVLGGGILPKIQGAFLKSAFVERFLDKGRMQSYVAPVPVRLIVKEGAALLGAAAIATGRAS